MPPIETADLHQTAAYWAFAGYDGQGQLVVDAAVELAPPNGVRWEQTNKEIIGADGTPISIDASIFVGQAIAVGSVLRLGTLASVPDPPNNLMEVVSLADIPSLCNKYRQRTLFAQRIAQLPTLS